jgi:hypothetical protein
LIGLLLFYRRITDPLLTESVTGLEVGDWKNWTPTGGIPQPSNELLDTVALPDLEMRKSSLLDTVMSNKTLQEVEAEALQEFPEEESEGECI